MFIGLTYKLLEAYKENHSAQTKAKTIKIYSMRLSSKKTSASSLVLLFSVAIIILGYLVI